MLFPLMKCFTGMFRLQGDGGEGDLYLFISVAGTHNKLPFKSLTNLLHEMTSSKKEKKLIDNECLYFIVELFQEMYKMFCETWETKVTQKMNRLF